MAWSARVSAAAQSFEQTIRGAVGDWTQSLRNARPQYAQTATASALCLEHLFVDGFAIGGDEKKIDRRAVLLPHQQHRRTPTADAADGARAVWRKLAGVHHAQETFAVHDFARERLFAER